MSQRVRRSIPAPAHPISDKSKLLWERYYGPMQSAAATLNAAITNTQNIIASVIMEAEGFSSDTHLFDMGNLTIVPRPRGKGVNGVVE